VTLTNDKQQLLKMFDLQTEGENVEIIGELKIADKLVTRISGTLK